VVSTGRGGFLAGFGNYRARSRREGA
jgi:hypothetical protein